MILFHLYFASVALATWSDWKVKFGKSYHSKEEELIRGQVYESNMAQIEAHNNLYDQGLVSYKQGPTKFTDLTQEEQTAYLLRGVRGDPVPLTKCGNWSEPDFPASSER